MNRLRLTGVFPATAFSALATCSSVPRRVRRGPPGAVLADDLVAPLAKPQAGHTVNTRPSAMSLPGCSRRHWRLAGVADLDLMQARRHARFLVGHALGASLRALREAAPGLVARGLDAVESGWADQRPAPAARPR